MDWGYILFLSRSDRHYGMQFFMKNQKIQISYTNFFSQTKHFFLPCTFFCLYILYMALVFDTKRRLQNP